MSDSKKGKILIAEDEKAIGKALGLKLEHIGYEAVVVNNGQEALERIKEGGYDLLLIDLIMPVMDGFSTLEALRKMGNKVPVVVLSNLSQGNDLKRARELGAKDYFIKSDTSLSSIVEYVERNIRQ